MRSTPVYSAIPADHDDDGGGVVWHAADRAGNGAGADARQPLGLAVVGGLFFSQFITLYITPVIYLYLEGAAQRVGRIRIWRRAAPAEQMAEPVAH